MRGDSTIVTVIEHMHARRFQASSKTMALSAALRPGKCGARTALRACRVGLGYDEGTVLVKIGREEPVASMDASGKVIWARHNEVLTANVKSLGAGFEDVRPCCALACWSLCAL